MSSMIVNHLDKRGDSSRNIPEIFGRLLCMLYDVDPVDLQKIYTVYPSTRISHVHYPQYIEMDQYFA